jgi:hypothetical protein
MANRRMFNKEIVNSDAFSSMPISSQALYFHLGMEADDDGFINNPLRVVRAINVSSDDLNLLLVKRFILQFQSGVIVIKHWRKNNQIRYDRYKTTTYKDEAMLLYVKDDGTYTLNAENTNAIPFMAPNGVNYGNQLATQYSIDKVSVVKVSEDKLSKSSSKNVSIIKPTDKPTTDKDFMEVMDAELGNDTTFQELERIIKYNFKPVRGDLLTETEQRMLIDWIKAYPYEFIENTIRKIGLGDISKRNFRYLNGAITKSYNEWLNSDKGKLTEDEEIAKLIAEAKAKEGK